MRKEVMEILRNAKIAVLEKELETVKNSMEEFLLKEFNRTLEYEDDQCSIEAGYYNQCPRPWTPKEKDEFRDMFLNHPEITDGAETMKAAVWACVRAVKKIEAINRVLESIEKEGVEAVEAKTQPRTDGMYDNDFAVKAEVREILTVIKTGATDPFQVLLELLAKGVM